MLFFETAREPGLPKPKVRTVGVEGRIRYIKWPFWADFDVPPGMVPPRSDPYAGGRSAAHRQRQSDFFGKPPRVESTQKCKNNNAITEAWQVDGVIAEL